jgi:hypothetical protein
MYLDEVFAALHESVDEAISRAEADAIAEEQRRCVEILKERRAEWARKADEAGEAPWSYYCTSMEEEYTQAIEAIVYGGQQPEES